MAWQNKNKKQKLAEGAFDQVLMQWYSPEFLRYERGVLWFLTAGLIDALLILYAVMTGSLTMLLVFVLIPVIYFLEHHRKPKTVEVIVSPYGIKFGDMKLAYTDIKKFWILHDPPHLNELRLHTTKKFHPEVTIPLLDIDPSIIRNYLVTQIPEWEGKQESLLDVIIRVFKLA